MPPSRGQSERPVQKAPARLRLSHPFPVCRRRSRQSQCSSMRGRWRCQTPARQIYGQQEQFPCVCELHWTHSLSPPFVTPRLGTVPLPPRLMARCSPTRQPSPRQRPQSRGSPPGGRAAAVLPLAARPAACVQRGDSVLGVQMGRRSSGAEFPRPHSQLAGLSGGSASACRKGLSVHFPLWMPGLLFASGHCPAQQPGRHRASGWQGGDGRRWTRTRPPQPWPGEGPLPCSAGAGEALSRETAGTSSCN